METYDDSMKKVQAAAKRVMKAEPSGLAVMEVTRRALYGDNGIARVTGSAHVDISSSPLHVEEDLPGNLFTGVQPSKATTEHSVKEDAIPPPPTPAKIKPPPFDPKTTFPDPFFEFMRPPPPNPVQMDSALQPPHAGNAASPSFPAGGKPPRPALQPLPLSDYISPEDFEKLENKPETGGEAGIGSQGDGGEEEHDAPEAEPYKQARKPASKTPVKGKGREGLRKK